jgi:septal ring factor EnvC (AmiA/AmiB activator)
MTYLFLVLLALIFALLGFLLHAFYFSGPVDVVLLKEVKSLEKALAEKQKEFQEGQEEIVKSDTLVRSLEEQIRTRNAEMEVLQRMIARQDEGIRQLQKDAVALRASLGSYAKSPEAEPVPSLVMDESVPSDSSVVREPVNASPSLRNRVENAAADAKDGDTPAWRENLNNILNILDSMEKEIEK